MSADDVGMGRPTVEKDAVKDAGVRGTGRLRGNIAKQRKAKKPTGSTKKSEGGKKIKKPWLIRVLHPGRCLI